MEAEIERGHFGKMTRKSGLEKKKDPSVDIRTQASHLKPYVCWVWVTQTDIGPGYKGQTCMFKAPCGIPKDCTKNEEKDREQEQDGKRPFFLL